MTLVAVGVVAACLAVGATSASKFHDLEKHEEQVLKMAEEEFSMHLRAAMDKSLDMSGTPEEASDGVHQLDTLLADIAKLRLAIMTNYVRVSRAYLSQHSGASDAQLSEVEADLARGLVRATGTVIEATADKWKQVVVVFGRYASEELARPALAQLQAHLEAPFDVSGPQGYLQALVGDNEVRIAQADATIDELFACSAPDCKQLSVVDAKSIASDATISEWVRGTNVRDVNLHPVQIPADVVAEAKLLSLDDLVAFRRSRLGVH